MPSPSRFASSIRKLEDLPSDGQSVDVLSGGLLRTFVRLERLEAALAKVTSRVAVLGKGAGVAEAARKPRPRRAGLSKTPSATETAPERRLGGLANE
jgi:hypothetical protein